MELEQIREEDAYNKKKVDSLSSELVLHQTKNQKISRDFDKAHKEVGYSAEKGMILLRTFFLQEYVFIILTSDS